MLDKYNPNHWKYYNYDTTTYNFRALVCDILGRADLENLHDSVNYPDLLTMKTEQSTVYHKEFYKQVRGSKFLDTYNKFIENIVKPHFRSEQIVFQKIPTFRTQFLNNISVSKWHKDKNYSHSVNERNFYLSITDSVNTNAVWAESEENKGDYKPLNSEYGEYIIWDGANCHHGNKENDENFTRVSFDFRAMLYSDYAEHEKAGKKSVNAHVNMVLGEYYESI